MGPLSHTLAAKAVGAPWWWGVLPDIPVVLARKDPRWFKVAEAMHGWPLGLLACALGPEHLRGWAVHVALDSVSHRGDAGAIGRGPRLWLP